MSDVDQAVYNAVRSRISSCDVGSAISEAVGSQFGMASHYLQLLHQDFSIVASQMQRPSVLFRPKLEAHGSRWRATYGDDVAGFGDTPDSAMEDFDKNWYAKDWHGVVPP